MESAYMRLICTFHGAFNIKIMDITLINFMREQLRLTTAENKRFKVWETERTCYQ